MRGLRAAALLLTLVLIPAQAALLTADETCSSERWTVNGDLLDELLLILPESTRINEGYVVDQEKSFAITSDMVGGQIEVTFMHEGAGYRNRFGYFLFDPDTLEDASDIIESETVWNNASYRHSGGRGQCMQRGHTAIIEIEKDWVGYSLGFWLHSNGYNNANNPYWYTEEILNRDSSEHAAVIQTVTDSQRLVLGWEDIDRRANGCDHDFNDLLLTVTSDPPELIEDIADAIELPTPQDSDGDGVLDVVDDFPDDPDLVINNSYPSGQRRFTIAAEDLYPSVGDGDYNDLIVAGRLHEALTPDHQIGLIRGGFYTIARGAGYDHELHLRIANTGSGDWTITTFDADGEEVDARTGRSTGDDLDLTLWESTKEAMPLMNTRVDQGDLQKGQWLRFSFTPDTPIDPDQIDAPPYDPYLLVLDTGYDIHRYGKSPVSGTNTPSNEDFLNDEGYPWILVFPVIWDFPEEKVLIDDVFSAFQTWRSTSGASETSWYTQPAGRYRQVDDEFFTHDLLEE